MWAGLVSGVTPCMVALSAPYWSRKANQLGPRKVMMFILFTLMVTVGACAFTQTPLAVIDVTYLARCGRGLCSNRIGYYYSRNP